MKRKEEQFKYFESQDPDENIILIVRKHPLVLASPFIMGTVMAISVITLYSLFLLMNVIMDGLVRAVFIWLVFVTLLYIPLLSFKAWLIKYLDILILSSKHLVVIQQDGLFKRGVSVLDLGTIQDVAIRQHGILQTLFGFGKIDVQTAGEAPNFVYSGVGNPATIQDAIMDAKEAYLKRNHHSRPHKH